MTKRIKNSANNRSEHAEKPALKLKTRNAGERTHAEIGNKSEYKRAIEVAVETFISVCLPLSILEIVGCEILVLEEMTS